MIKSPYISHVEIENFRNFENVDVDLSHKQVIIGENNVGKTNYIYALQLILDPTLSEQDRMLNESDFYEGIEEPFKNKKVIRIMIQIANYQHNKNILSQITDGTIIDENGEEKLQITYKFRPTNKNNKYEYIIYKGNKEENSFTYKDREVLNIKVIGALRDVEKELKSTSKSPINKMLKEYDIDLEDIQEIVDKMHDDSEKLLDIDEIVDVTNKINNVYSNIMGKSDESQLELNTVELKADKLLYSMKLLKDTRGISENSLGINNILYISLILSQLADSTVPTLLKSDEMDKLKEEEGSEILDLVYEETEKSNYFLKEDIEENQYQEVYEFMSLYKDQVDSFTILAIEEPEAHLHPINQRLIFREVIKNNNNSVILTTHSPHITSITPINSIVSLRKEFDTSTKIRSACNIELIDSEKLDIERYIDIKKSEIYFGKGVIFVEGIAEEYLIPKFSEILGYPLDEYGIVVCNINSTNFKPFILLCDKLDIPFAVITDGDFYYEYTNSKGEIKRKYHELYDKKDKRNHGWLGNEVIARQLFSLNKIDKSIVDAAPDKQDKKFKEIGIFISFYTLEVEIMDSCSKNEDALRILKQVYSELECDSELKQNRFNESLGSGDWFKCLKRIEARGVGKGRFAQRLSLACVEDHIPEYIEDAIEYIVAEVE